MCERSAPIGVKLFFWVILGALSVLFAEVVSTATMFPVISIQPPFINIWGIFVVFPLYTLHVLVLSSLIFRRGRITFSSLFLAGAILGLYEAYITKVLWNPTWGNPPVMAGGIAIGQTAILVLFWHPIMAFVLPVVFGENLYTSSSETFGALPARLRAVLSTKRGAIYACIALGLLCGSYHSLASTNPIYTGTSALLAASYLLALGWGWKRLRAGREYSLRELLPDRKQTYILAGLLGIVYLVSALFMRREAMPVTLEPHLIIWLMYAVLFTLLHFSLKRSAGRDIAADSETIAHPSPLRLNAETIGIVFLIAFTLFSAIFPELKLLSWILAVLTLFFGGSFGAVTVVLSLVAAIRGNRRPPSLAQT